MGDDGVIDAVFRQSAVIRVDSLEDLIVTGELLARAALSHLEQLQKLVCGGGGDGAGAAGGDIAAQLDAARAAMASLAGEEEAGPGDDDGDG